MSRFGAPPFTYAQRWLAVYEQDFDTAAVMERRDRELEDWLDRLDADVERLSLPMGSAMPSLVQYDNPAGVTADWPASFPDVPAGDLLITLEASMSPSSGAPTSSMWIDTVPVAALAPVDVGTLTANRHYARLAWALVADHPGGPLDVVGHEVHSPGIMRVYHRLLTVASVVL